MDVRAAASKPPGLRARSETNEPHDSMKNADGAWLGAWSASWKPRTERFRWKYGVMKNR